MDAKESFIPYVGKIIDIKQETPDVKTFSVVGLDGKKLFEHIPGQCAMLIVPGVGESMISITSSPTLETTWNFQSSAAAVLQTGCITQKLVSRFVCVDQLETAFL